MAGGAADHENIVAQRLFVLDVHADMQIVFGKNDIFRFRHFRDADIVAETRTQFETPVPVAKKGFKHFIINGVAQFFVACARQKAVTNDVVNTREGSFLFRDKYPLKPRFNGFVFPFLQKNTRRSFSQGAEDFIADRLCLGGNFIGADAFFFLLPQQNDLIADFAIGNMGDVHRAHIHGNPSDDGSPLTMNERCALVG